jgi:hypothetical protein
MTDTNLTQPVSSEPTKSKGKVSDYFDFEIDTPKDTEALKRIMDALDLGIRWGVIDGGHHKMWTIDQMIRALLGDDYEQVIAKYNKENIEVGYGEWDKGIAP